MNVFRRWFQNIVSALSYSLAGDARLGHAPHLYPPYNDVARLVLEQHGRMTDHLRLPLQLVTYAFDVVALFTHGRRFHRLEPAQRAQRIEKWRQSGIGLCRDFVKFYESLATLAVHSRANTIAPTVQAPLTAATVSPKSSNDGSNQSAQIIVVGSGPGGAVTAALLAEAGCDVLLVEEGPFLALNSCPPFTLDEMRQKYRNGGLTVAMGKTKIAYAEGRCVGGGSEINSGLYHRTPEEILERWRKEFQVEGLATAELTPHFEACERDVCVSPMPAPAPRASLLLAEGAAKQGWKSQEVPRWFQYNGKVDENGTPQGIRQTMTQTFIPRALKAGCRLLTGTRIDRLQRDGARWRLEGQGGDGQPVNLSAETVFLACGAVQTPALLRRSGITANVGNALHLHPTVKLAARFPETVNFEGLGVPVHQVKEYSPRMSFGCSISSRPFLALSLLDNVSRLSALNEAWPQMAVYYAMITGTGHGVVRPLPGFRDPLVRYHLTEADRRDLADGLKKLAELLLAAGAVELLPSVARAPAITSREDVRRFGDTVPEALTNLMTIHLFSSCPMGENPALCAADSFGCVRGFENLLIADASLLCTAPGVNPQGSIMAVARRNVLRFLERTRPQRRS